MEIRQGLSMMRCIMFKTLPVSLLSVAHQIVSI